MAIKIPIVTVFDNNGIKRAQSELGKVSKNFQNLGRNFAIAGAAVGAFAVGIGKAVNAASNLEAEFEGVNQVFGKAAATVQDFAKQAATSAGLTETAALQASKVFGLFAKGAGQSDNAAAKFATTMVQLAGDLGSFNDVPTEEALAAIQSGLQGQAEPLRRFGIFLDDARLKAEALNMGIYNGKGPLSTQQKMMAAYESILKQTNIQQGDFLKYSDTYGNQLKTLQSEFANLTAEVGGQFLPIMAEIIPVIREAITEVGPKLKEALASVDWAGLAKSFGEVLTVLVENIETIGKVVAAMFILNTAYNAGKVAIGLYNAAAVIGNVLIGATGTAAAGASVGVGLLNTALGAGVFGAVLATIGLIATGFYAVATNARLASEETKKVYENTKAELIAEPWRQAANPARVYVGLVSDIKQTGFSSHVSNIKSIEDMWVRASKAASLYKPPSAGRTSVMDDYAYNLRTGQPTPKTGKAQSEFDKMLEGLTPPGGGGGGGGSKPLTLSQQLKREGTIATKEAKLISKGLSEGLASKITGSATPIKAANAVLSKIAKNGQKAVNNLQKQFNKTKAGKAEIANLNAQAAAAAEQASAEAQRIAEQQAAEEQRIADELARAQQEEADREAAILAERERVYNSFLDSVKQTFANIRNSIMGAFDITQLGGSTNSITRNMEKLLTRLRSFATNVKNLSGMGLDPALLQQVIAAGPLAGARLAQTLVAGGANALASINAGFNEFGILSSQIATTGTNALFGTQAQQNIYNINVDGGVGSGATIGKAIVDAIKAYERTSGAVWQGA